MGSEKLWGDNACIETSTGAIFRLRSPQFNIEDIAHGASRKCRFNGQCKYFYPVSAHAIMVSRIVAAEGHDVPAQTEGLLHDGNESYLPDVPSPYKRYLPDLRAMEGSVDRALREWHDLPPEKSEAVQYADVVALMIEAWYLLPSQGTTSLWDALQEFRAPAQAYLRRGFRIPMYDVPPAKAKDDYLKRYWELTNQL